MPQNIFNFINERNERGELAVLITVVKTEGSSPASVGQLMAVDRNGEIVGTVGGGATEFKLIKRSQKAIEDSETVFEFDYDHSESGMVCGGGMSGFGTVMGNSNSLYIFGAGHVGQSLAKIALTVGFDVTVIDDRMDMGTYLDEKIRFLPINHAEFENQINVRGKAYCVICTRGHKNDSEALDYAINKPFKYIGMIGSRKKVQSVFDGLRCSGVSEEKLQKVYTPIGLDIASEVPAEIAISILAEILCIKNGGKPNHRRDAVK